MFLAFSFPDASIGGVFLIRSVSLLFIRLQLTSYCELKLPGPVNGQVAPSPWVPKPFAIFAVHCLSQQHGC
jgi:hypothetical protein